MKKGNSSSLRKGRFSEEGRIYHVTFTTHHRKPILEKMPVARLVVNVLKNESINTQTLAYVVMPDHVHWLLQLEHKSLNKTLH